MPDLEALWEDFSEQAQRVLYIADDDPALATALDVIAAAAKALLLGLLEEALRVPVPNLNEITSGEERVVFNIDERLADFRRRIEALGAPEA